MKFKVTLLILTLLILVASFYWFQYLPYTIRKSCHTATTKILSNQTYYNAGDTIPEEYADTFNACLHSNGIQESNN